MPKAIQIKSMFNNISKSYDLLNDVLSLGIHRVWKNKFVSNIIKENPGKILDCATGTGDIAINIKNSNPSSNVVGIDFSENMLKVAEQKTDSIKWQVQDVMNLDFEDKSFDVSCISYGIRNVENHQAALKEMARVTKDKICILEFGQPQNSIFKCLYFGIMNYFMPLIGKLFNKESAYKYLVDSSKSFPCAQKFCDDIKTATDFKYVKFIPLFGGVTYIYIASNKI